MRQEGEKRMKFTKKDVLSKLPTSGAFYAIIIFVVAFSLTADNYLSVGNLINLLRQASAFCIITACLFLALLTGQNDLSVGATASLSSVVAALALQGGYGVGAAICLSLVIGVAMGACNGVLISRTNIAPFIITFATMSIGESLGLIITGGHTVPVNEPVILAISGYLVFGTLPVCVVITLIIFLILWYVMKKRPFGTALYAIGGNTEAATASGINVPRHKFIVYIVNGILAAIAGLILVARIGTANPTQGIGLEFEGICGAVLGGTALSGGRGSIGNAFLGAFAIAIMKNGLNMLGMKTGYQMIVLGTMVVVIMALDAVTNAVKGGRAK